MDSNQKLLINLLSAAIRGNKPEKTDWQGVDWQAILEEAKAHEVYTLVYPVIKNLEVGQGPNNEIISVWHKATLISAILQAQHIQHISEVFKIFNKSGIPVIALKGLILRELYPQPELRTMGDADLLVHKEDFKRSKKLLLQMGYQISYNDSKHINFVHKYNSPIELHRSLICHNYFKKDTSNFDNAIWDNAITSSIHEENILVLSPEDQLLHLLLHMAEHIVSTGFGLRQLCDLVLFVELKTNLINWESFLNAIKQCDIEKFGRVIFKVCELIFNLKVPEGLTQPAIEDIFFIDMLINDIFSGGVFGKRTTERMAGNKLLLNVKNNSQGDLPNRLVCLISYLFPSPIKLADNYSYARKYKILTPLAWIHRTLRALFNKNFFTPYKVLATKPMSIFKERSKLLIWLDLR